MRKFITTIAALVTLSVAVPAAAATGPVYNDEGAIVDTSGPTKRLLFEEGETLEGEVLRLDETTLYSNRGRHHKSLISIKSDFIYELIMLSLDTPI
jgi:hypothetical protein